ncbi:Outer membrane protein (OmpH-like) [Halarsenatibacter silvermanii]|uniref:Outer membrane protein (OmpH-like) n=1 Tax=Halarsenatibacter silvermanii TaxID=321763 RepID=A0A1G9MV80_9FIRM|nr:Outer membrane protein (OmpH-like) [Halarsenatibacter silvermanii]
MRRDLDTPSEERLRGGGFRPASRTLSLRQSENLNYKSSNILIQPLRRLTIDIRKTLIAALIAIGLTASLGLGVQAQTAEADVATIDMQEVLMAHPAIQDAQQQLQEEQMEMMAELEDMGEEEAAGQQQEMQQDLEMLQQDLMESAMDEAAEDIDEVAQDLGYEVVLDQEGVITGEDELNPENITEDVMDELDIEAEMPDEMEMQQ